MGQRMGRGLYFVSAILERSDFNPLVQMGNEYNKERIQKLQTSMKRHGVTNPRNNQDINSIPTNTS